MCTAFLNVRKSGLSQSPVRPFNCQIFFAAVQQYPPDINMQNARAEAEMVMFESVAKALKKANLRPNQVSSQRPDFNFKMSELISALGKP